MCPLRQLSWRGPTILGANESAALLSLTLRSPEPLLQLTAHLVLHTNVTELRLPVTCYTGKLRPVRYTHTLSHMLHGQTQTSEIHTYIHTHSHMLHEQTQICEIYSHTHSHMLHEQTQVC